MINKLTKKLNKKIIIPLAILLCLCGVAAFLTFKTTLVAGVVACTSEQVSLKEYMQVQMMPKEYNFSSYKEALVYQIRVDKAAKQRALEEAQRTEVAYEPIKELAQILSDGYTYIDTTATEQENAEKYRNYMDSLQLETVTEVEKTAITDLLASIANTTHFVMSTDVYYKGYTTEQIKDLTEGFQASLKSCTVTEEFIIEQITPGEYDPVPELGIAKEYTADIGKAAGLAESTEYPYDYIVRLSRNHEISADVPLLKESITAIVSEQNYVVLEAGAVLYDQDIFPIAAHGSVRPYGSMEYVIAVPEEPVLLQLTGMREKTEEFMGLAYDTFKLYFDNEAAIEEWYGAYYTVEDVEDEAIEGTEGTVEASENEPIKEVDYDSLQLVQMVNSLQTDIETKYSVDTEWANILFLSDLSNMLAGASEALLTERFLNENKEEWEVNGITQAQVDEFVQKAGKIKVLQANLSEPVLVQERLLLPETVLTEDFGSVIANKNLADLQRSFSTGYETWCEGEVSEILYGGYYQYEFPGIATVELAVVYAEQGIFITEMGMKWTDAESLFAELSTSYTTPNTVRMYKEAESSISREAYSTEEAYQRAINQWLSTNYPQYYGNVSSQTGAAASSNYTYRGGYGGSRILRSIRDAANTVEDVWYSAGYALEGTLAGYLFTNNGHFRSFGDDVENAVEEIKEEANALAKEVKQEVNTMVNGVKNWWYGLWH